MNNCNTKQFQVVAQINFYSPPEFECTYDVPYMLLPYTTMQCGRVFLEEKKKLNNSENEYI